jgi:hypothetical protein
MLQERGAHQQPEDRSAVIAAAGLFMPLVLCRRCHSVVRDVVRKACVPTLTIRRRSPVLVLRSPSSMKKYTPRCGQGERPWLSASSRLPSILRSRFSRML